MARKQSVIMTAKEKKAAVKKANDKVRDLENQINKIDDAAYKESKEIEKQHSKRLDELDKKYDALLRPLDKAYDKALDERARVENAPIAD